MDEKDVLAYLGKRKKAELLDLLRTAFRVMDATGRREVFGHIPRRPATAAVDGKRLRREIGQFRRDSLAGKYYAPFDMNSRNYTWLPPETEEWCARFDGFVADATALTAQGGHSQAVACFAMLYELFHAVESGEEIVFSHDGGSDPIRADERVWMKAYLTSLAATATPQAFAAAAPMIERDDRRATGGGLGVATRRAATPAQKAALEAELRRRG